jgi:hypothetical protein
MDKALVFISHISPEKEIAIAFKELIEEAFLGLIDVFVSSDEHSVSLGQKWLDNITSALRTCSIEIILCSPVSVGRPWINFEAGAGWVRDIPVIPLCHSGISPSELPLPLNLLQGASAGELSSLNLLFPVLAQALGAKTPKFDFSKFITKVAEFERRYTFWDACNKAFGFLDAFHADLIPALRQGKRIEFELTETQIGRFEDATVFLGQSNILSFVKVGGVSMTPQGTSYSCSLVPLSKLSATFADANFKPNRKA